MFNQPTFMFVCSITDKTTQQKYYKYKHEINNNNLHNNPVWGGAVPAVNKNAILSYFAQLVDTFIMTSFLSQSNLVKFEVEYGNNKSTCVITLDREVMKQPSPMRFVTPERYRSASDNREMQGLAQCGYSAHIVPNPMFNNSGINNNSRFSQVNVKTSPKYVFKDSDVGIVNEIFENLKVRYPHTDYSLRISPDIFMLVNTLHLVNENGQPYTKNVFTLFKDSKTKTMFAYPFHQDYVDLLVALEPYQGYLTKK